MTTTFIGENFNHEYDAVEIAAKIRKEIWRKVGISELPDYKYTVRTKRKTDMYENGLRKGDEYFNYEWSDHIFVYIRDSGDLDLYKYRDEDVDGDYTDHAKNVLKEIMKIMKSYNYRAVKGTKVFTRFEMVTGISAVWIRNFAKHTS